MALLKAEFLYQWQEANGYSLRNRFFAYSGKINRFFSAVPWLYNMVARSKILSYPVKKMLGIAVERKLPVLNPVRAGKWFELNKPRIRHGETQRTVYLFLDEFIDTMDLQTAKAVRDLLHKLNYEVIVIDRLDSGRSYISKGFLKQAKEIANRNVSYLKDLVNEEYVLVGIEPSAVLTFRDEYIRLVDEGLKEAAEKLAGNTYLFEEFIWNEYRAGRIRKEQFTRERKKITLHVHCHHKALSDENIAQKILSIPENYEVELLDSGCCGMAGSFGYEKEHYDLSLKVGELKLFPALRRTEENTLIAANGISCRHQIDDVLHKKAVHPAVLLAEAVE
jgi:Fe-S oxidoreductase